MCFQKSFQSSLKANCWSPKNKKTPREVFLNSHTKYSFICDNPNCLHSFDAALNKINSGTWCPYCCLTRKICPDKECQICKKSSFAQHPNAKFWSPKNEGKPSDYTSGTHKKFLFDCPTCNHTFSAALNHITGDNRWCPYCAQPSKKLCKDEDCDFCYQRSFAPSDKVSFWSKKNKVTPREVIVGSHDKYFFDCGLCGHDFEMSLQSVTQGCWCGCRKKKTETKLLTWLHENFPGQVTYQPKFDWCKSLTTNKFYPFDYLIKIPGQKVHKILELDGLQHFQQVMNWDSPEKTRARDMVKEFCARSNGFSVVRILQEDVLYDKIDWEDLLTLVLSENHSSPQLIELYDGIEIIEKRIFTLNFVGIDDVEE
jgi:transcription elongation factor Elf1